MVCRYRVQTVSVLVLAGALALNVLAVLAVPISEDNVHDLEEIRTWSTQSVPVLALEVSEDGNRIYGTKGNILTVWDASSGEILNSWQADPGYAAAIDLSPDEALLATAGSDGAVNLWDALTGSRVRRLYPAGTHTVAFSPDGRQIASGAREGILRAWDVETGGLVHEITAGSGMFEVGFSHDGTKLASVHGLPDFAVRLWDAESGDLLWESFDHSGDVHSLAFSPNDERLATVSGDGEVFVFDVSTGQRVRSLVGHQAPLFQVVFITNALLASSDGSGQIRFWNVDRGLWLDTLSIFQSQVTALAISPDTELLVAASFDMRVAQLSVAEE